MGSSSVESKMAHFGETQRLDAWWVEILPIILLMGGFSVYATFRAIEGRYYEWWPYLSPFYSPLIDPHHHWLPQFITPAMLILVGPLGFRATCYYYRKAFYRAFLLDPPACAVGRETRQEWNCVPPKQYFNDVGTGTECSVCRFTCRHGVTVREWTRATSI